MDRDAIATRIFSSAENYAYQREAAFGSDAKGDIQQFALRAALEIANAPRDQQEGRTNAVILAFRRLVDEMIKQSDRKTGYSTASPSTIGEYTLRKALEVLCPLFPFC